MSEKAPKVNHEEISDIVKVGSDGKARRGGGMKGQFMSEHEAGLIAEHADFIRDNLPEEVGESSAEMPKEGETNGKTPEEVNSPEGKDLSKLTNEELAALGKDAQDAQQRVTEEQRRRTEEKQKNSDIEPHHVDHWLNLDDDLDAYEEEVEPIEAKELVELDPELSEKLKEAGDRYAFLTARDRQAFIGRFMKKETRLGKLLGKIPGVKSVAERLNERQGKEIDDAIAEYKKIVDNAVRKISEYYESNGATPEALDIIKRTELLAHSAALEAKIITKREELAEVAGGAGFWTNQWVNGGKLKKAGIVLAAGAAAGAVVATGGAALGIGSIFGMSSGALAGGLAGGKVAHGITRRRAGAVYEEGNKAGGQAGETVAEHQSYLDQKEYGANIENDSDVSADTVVSGVEKSSDEEMYRNRKRVRTARALGAAAGGASGFAARAAFEGIFGGSKSATVEAVGPDAKPPKDVADTPKPKVVDNIGETTHPAKEVLKGNHFNVEYGNGFSHEWVDWAQANGKNLNIEDAYKLHEAVRGKFGDAGIINKLGTYVENGDLRIASPGQTAWKPEVAQFAQKWLEARGKW